MDWQAFAINLMISGTNCIGVTIMFAIAIVVLSIRSYIERVKEIFAVLQNPPYDGQVIDPLSLKIFGKEVWRHPKESITFRVPKREGVGEDHYVTEEVVKQQTKTPYEDFSWAYENAKAHNLTKRQAYYAWMTQYPHRVLLSDKWRSFKHGMKTQEERKGRIWGEESDRVD